jgi:two-component system cell cycle sensor histidine kinase/response regulator CckA
MNGGLRSLPGPARVPQESDGELALLRAVLDEIPDPMFLKDCEGRMLVANRAALNIMGRPADQVLGKTAPEYLDDSEFGLELLRSDLRVLETGTSESAEQVIPGPGGNRVFLTTRSPFRDSHRNLIGVIGISRNITERKAAETALRENADRLALILEATSGGVWDWNLQTGDATFSPRYSTMLGYAPDELARNYRHWEDMIHPDDVDRIKQHHVDYLAGLTDYSIEFRIKEKSGAWHWVHSRGLLIERDPDGNPLRMVGTHSDIQGRKRAEAELAHAQKMESVGRLAGGIAHDFSNLMSVILLHADSALESLSGEHPASDSVSAMKEAAEKAVALTRRLLAFSQKREGKPELLDLNSALVGWEKLVRPLIGEDIELAFHPGAGLPKVEVDPGQLYQVVMNFAVNARDAMPHGGAFTIETATVHGEATACIPDARPGPYVSVSFRDTGVGMDPETQARAFEPFFTTKEVGKGTGLGLSVVYSIVKQSNGHITLQSEPGLGTEFRIYLPAVLADRVPVAGTNPAPILCGAEAILLVEDEDLLRNTVGAVLRHAGYRVLVAPDVDRAIEMDLQTTSPIELLLTDIVMPGVSGVRLAKHLLQVHPDLAVLFMSGYPEAAGGAPPPGEGNLIRKPFTAEQLLLRVRKVLDRRQERFRRAV